MTAHGIRMIDVAAKPVTLRRARASALVRCRQATVERLRSGTLDKGDALAVARLAGVIAAKRTADVVPLCHPLPLDAVEVSVLLPPPANPADTSAPVTITIETVVRATARTGVEMEALVAATAAALALYDCCKSIDRGMVIQRVQLEEKQGGHGGAWLRQTESP